MLTNALERQLCQQLRDHPARFGKRYSDAARRDLLHLLFLSMANWDDNYLHLFFPNGPPTADGQAWSLSDSQGAVEGAEYTETARGSPCGHIIRDGEATYSCRTCSTDETCVLCARCFEASDHEGHQVSVSWSPSGSGCCDCGDVEAWVRPINCSIHTLAPGESKVSKDKGKAAQLPDEIAASIKTTIGRALDYMCDVFSCSSESMRLPKTEEAVRKGEEQSRLKGKWYRSSDKSENDSEFALVLWNDEKHTVPEVMNSVAKACKQTRSFGLAKAMEVDDVGRSVIEHSHDLKELLRKARIIEQIKVTVTVRSSRDTYREQMCGTIIEWLTDIAGCAVGQDTKILRQTICEEMLKPWRVGSPAVNADIGRKGIPDHARTDKDDLRYVGSAGWRAQVRAVVREERAIARRVRAELQAAAQRVEGQAMTEAERAVVAEAVAQNVIDTDDEDDEDYDDDLNESEDEDDMNIDDDMDLDEALVMDDRGVLDTEGLDERPDRPVIMTETIIGPTGPIQPPSPPTVLQSQNRASDESDEEASRNNPDPRVSLARRIPETPSGSVSQSMAAPSHWIGKPEIPASTELAHQIPVYEDLERHPRLDFMILYDIRMWKRLRNDLRDLYISTVVNIPSFKRIIGLRFTALYTMLAQLYLIADREPDLSIISLSLQMLTTPSITAEIVQRGKFFTKLLAILYTFSTKRQVANPHEVDPAATLAIETGAATNRRIFHFFTDMKYLLSSEYVQERIRSEDEFLLQFLDFAKLYQGICPNKRAVEQHIEYESDIWINVQSVISYVTRMCRQFSESFKWTLSQSPESICRAIRQTAKTTIINSTGAESERFKKSVDIQKVVEFHAQGPFDFELATNRGERGPYKVVKFSVEKGPMSFHHSLHYVLSWLIDCGKSMSADQLRHLLTFTKSRLEDRRAVSKLDIPDLTAEEYLLALFDVPLRVCAWLAQMKAGMWVRNGITLRHQMSTYRGVPQRDLSHQRDLFLLQTACVIVSPSAFIASAIDRFGVLEWVKGHFVIPEGIDDQQMIDVAEDFLHLLIVLVSDRTYLVSTDEEPHTRLSTARRDIIQSLAFKPLPNSELAMKLPERHQEMPEFPKMLEELTTYKAPDGLSDSGTLELKSQYIEEVDPYYAYYSRNQREEAEATYRAHMAKKTGKSADEVVFEPKLRQIRSGVFVGLAAFTQTPLFAQTMYNLLRFVLDASLYTPKLPATRIEAFLGTLLHLGLIATLEDKNEEAQFPQRQQPGFAEMAMDRRLAGSVGREKSIVEQLHSVFVSETFKSCNAKARVMLRRLQQVRPNQYASTLRAAGIPIDRLQTASPAGAGLDPALKKKQALERQARVMAQFKQQQNDFLENQTIDWGVDDEEMSDLESPEEVHSGLVAKARKFPTGTCIFCQEDTGDHRLYGTLAYISETNLIRQTDVNDAEYIAEVIATPPDLDRSADSIRPFGVAAQNVEMVTRLRQDGTTLVAARQVLGRGFPASCHAKAVVTTGCGHLMHWTCFEIYNSATRRRQAYQVARNHPERAARHEFTCPLCKALGNIFLPISFRAQDTTPFNRMHPKLDLADWLARRQTTFERSNTPADTHMTGVPRSEGPGEMDQRWQQRMDRQATTVNNIHYPAMLTRPDGAPELVVAYRRLSETIKYNRLETMFSSVAPVNGFVALDVMVKALAFSVASLEIAQRGVMSAPISLLDSISPQIITHLSIVSETTKRFTQVGGLSQAVQVAKDNYTSLLYGSKARSHSADGEAPLLELDSFIVFASWCMYNVTDPVMEDTMQMLSLCYLAEVVKMVVAFLQQPEKAWNYAAQMDHDKAINDDIKMRMQPTEAGNFSAFVLFILQNLGYHGTLPAGVDADALHNPNTRYAFDRFLWGAAGSYALSFLRKALFFLHIRYNMDLSSAAHLNPDVPELTRLSSLLETPSLSTLIEQFHNSELLQHTVGSWLHALHDSFTPPTPSSPASFRLVRLPHPAIYELVALPHIHDVLTSVAMSHKCPTTGRDMTDPCVCLFCGAIFCGQASCCARGPDKEGGCYQHLDICGGAVDRPDASTLTTTTARAAASNGTGIYLNIRKCAVIFLHGSHGTFIPAPYLDKYGEADMGLRRRGQLFLNQRRYDKLIRDVWLQHGIASVVARKLEGDVNTGGWETL